MARRSRDEKEFFESSLREHESPLVRYVLKLVGKLEIAREIVQDSFLKWWGSEDFSKISQKIPAWLYLVSRNRAVDILRREKKVEKKPDMDEFSKIELPENMLEKSDIYKMISKLSSRHQELILLKFQSGLKYREIADITGLSVSNVGYLLHEAMSELKSNFYPDQIYKKAEEN